MFQFDVVKKTEELIGPIAAEEGLSLYDIEWAFDGGRRILRVLVEKEGGVSLGDCARLSHAVEDLIEVKEVVPGRYDLEVSSPGFNRPLKKKEHFERVVGQGVRLKTREPLHGRQNYKGVLKRMEGEVLVVEIDRKEFLVPLQMVAKANKESDI